MHVLTNAEKLIPLRDAASLAESRRLAGMRMVTGTTSPSTRYERISVSPASCSIKSEYVIASHAFKPQYKCINYTPAWEQRKLGELMDVASVRRVHQEDWTDEGVRFLRARDLVAFAKNESIEDPLFISSEMYKEYSAQSGKVSVGDLLVTGVGTIGVPWLVTSDNPVYFKDGNIIWFKNRHSIDGGFFYHSFTASAIQNCINEAAGIGTVGTYTIETGKKTPIWLPSRQEQREIAAMMTHLDTLITLHQRKRESRIIRVCSFIWLAGDISGIGVSAYQPEREDRMTEGNTNAETLFCDYYEQWISVYKEGAIREVTMKKYRLTQAWLGRLIPDLKLADMDRVNYQKLINGYAEHHERQTTMDFHHQLKGAILDAVDEGLIQRDPTRKAIIKGKPPCSKKTKYLNQFELHAVLADLELGKGPSWDWLILLVAKTGLRFSEALGLTPDDFDFVHQTLSVSKTWDYKNGGGFVPTKNASSVRKVQLDWQLIMQLSTLLKDLPAGDPIFVNGKVYNSTANNILARHCERANVPVISIHGLRHTHASLLLFAGVSIASVSKRLGHASMNTTQDTYLHVIRELENKDVDIVMRALSTLI